MIVNFVWLDWAILVVILVSTLISLKRGFFKESLSLLVWLVAFVVSLLFYPDVMVYLEGMIESPSLRKAAAIVILFAAMLLAGGVVNHTVAKLVLLTGLAGMDRLLGMVFGALRGVVVVVLLLMLGQALFPLPREQWWQQSVLVPYFVHLETWVVAASSEIRSLFSVLLGNVLDRAGN